MPSLTTPEHSLNIEPANLLAFGAHPDDLEFGVGGVLLDAAANGARIHLALASRGESGTQGTPMEREAEARAAAQLLRADITWIDLGGDAHMSPSPERAILLAEIIRHTKPSIVLAPTVVADQHPDHVVVGGLVRDALRLARYGKVSELIEMEPWHTPRFYQYAIAPSAEPHASTRLVVDISAQEHTWVELMQCHASQLKNRRYVDLQVARARMWGLQAGVELAQVLYTEEPLVFRSAHELPGTARLF